MDGNESILRVENLKTEFYTHKGILYAVRDVSFDVNAGEVLALVGESGCGKSVTALSIIRLIPIPPGRISYGHIWFKGKDLLTFTEKDMQSIRGRHIGMIFQEPMTALNPVFTIGDQVGEVLLWHGKATKKNIKDKVVELLNQVGISAPERRYHDYPHQLSGGMRQRVVIAMAIACRPSLILADEPTTALDVTIQAQILEIMMHLKEETGAAFLFITHDMGIVAEVADRVAVMYAGKIVELAEVRDLFSAPLHPYTQGLLESLPGKDMSGKKTRLKAIPGTVPNMTNLPKGCTFHDRCSKSLDICLKNEPPLIKHSTNKEVPHRVRCWLYA